jgi:mRNA interferase MazF
MAARFSPGRGDVIALVFGNRTGREQAGRRPALIVSPQQYNRRVGLALCCPITSQVRGYPFEVVLPKGLGVAGAVLSDQVRTLDWRARGAELICHLPAATTREVLEKLAALVSPDES